MFGLRVIRHRDFEGPGLSAPEHGEHHADYITVTGGGPCDSPSRPGIGGPRRKGTADEARAAMGIDWMTKAELNEAIPPAYTEFIGKQLLSHISNGVQGETT
jgi:DNA (cytosine-5)-methyltransferase 1